MAAILHYKRGYLLFQKEDSCVAITSFCQFYFARDNPHQENVASM